MSDTPAYWVDVEYARLKHASDPSMDCDIDLHATWFQWEPGPTTRERIIRSVVNGATRLNATTEKFHKRDSDRPESIQPITSIAVKFKEDAEETTMEIRGYSRKDK